MVFLKSLLFIPANILVAVFWVSLLRWLLFYPRKPRFIHGKKIPLTPGFAVKYHKIIMNKIDGLLKDFLYETDAENDQNRISKMEKKAFEKCYQWSEKHIHVKWLPRKILIALQVLIAEFAREFMRQFFRSFLPFIMERVNVKHYADLLHKNISIENIQKYYDKYIYRYSLYFFGFIALLTGITNMIIYLLIGG